MNGQGVGKQGAGQGEVSEGAPLALEASDIHKSFGANHVLKGVSVADRNELLFKAGINFNEVPAWQRRGIGIHWSDEPKRRPRVRFDLPMRSEFDALVRSIVERQ